MGWDEIIAWAVVYGALTLWAIWDEREVWQRKAAERWMRENRRG